MKYTVTSMTTWAIKLQIGEAEKAVLTDLHTCRRKYKSDNNKSNTIQTCLQMHTVE